MPNELDPRIDQWYAHLDKGQRFYVIDVDVDEDIVEVQHFDGDLEEFSLEEWRDLSIILSEEPENWSGALDVANEDDLGTGVTDAISGDWDEPVEDYMSRNR